MGELFTTLRENAEKRFTALHIPTAKDENFRFTNLKNLAFTSPLQTLIKNQTPLCFLKKHDDEQALLTLMNEKVQYNSCDNKKFVFRDILGAAPLYARQLSEALATPIFENDKFAQLAKARWQNGIFMHIPHGSRIKLPLRAIQCFTHGTHYFQSLLIIDDYAEVTFVNELESDEQDHDATFAYGLLQIIVGKHSVLRFAEYQNFSQKTRYFLRKHIHLKKAAKMHYILANTGGEAGQLHSKVLCAEPGANFVMHAGVSGTGNQQTDLWTDIEHLVPYTKSKIEVRMAIHDTAQGVFNGTIHIPKHSIKTEAIQKSHSLLLSPKAVVHALPKLKIEADDVKCEHGASISTLNPEQIHYLQTRGISKKAAEDMLIRGFMQTVVAKFPVKGLRKRVRQAFLGLVHE